MPQIFYKDGSPIPDAKVAEAIASGEGYARGGRVTVRDPSGTVGTIDASELGKPGYQPLTDAEIEAERIHQERSTLGQQALTVGEGAARGATLGLSDVATTGLLGDDYRKAAQERAGENRKLAIGSEVVGAIAPTLFSGGAAASAEGAVAAGREASLLTKAARLAPSSLVSSAGRTVERGVAGIIGDAAPSALARMAQRAAAVGASGAVEGGLYGAGNAVSEAALDGGPITAEKVLSGFGHGALFGGGLGAGLGALSGGASSAFERIVGGSEGLKAGAEKLANESALKAVGFQGSDFRKLIGRGTGEAAESKIADVGSELLNYTFDSGPLKGQKLFTGAKKAEDFVDDLALAKEEVGAKLGAIKSQVDAAGMAPDVEGYLARVKAEVLDPLRASSSPTVRAQADRVERELALLRERITPSVAPEVVTPTVPRTYDEIMDDIEGRLSKPEQDAINDYTTTSYKHMNDAHRDAKAYAEQWGAGMTAEKQIKNRKLLAALEKEVDGGNIYREEVQRVMDLPKETVDKWSNSSTISNDSFWSTTANPEAMAETTGGKLRGNVRLHIADSDAVPVGKFSKVAKEQEAIIPPGRTFFVDKSEDIDGVRHIWLEQVRPSNSDGSAFGSVAKAQEVAAPVVPVTFRELDTFRRDLRSVFQPPRPPGGGLPAPVPEHAAHLERAERILADELDKTVEQHLAAAGLDTTEYARNKRTFAALADIEKVANKAAAQQLGNRAISPSDYGVGLAGAIGSMLSGNVGGALLGAGGAIAHKIIRERGRSVLAVMADSVAKMDGRIAEAAKSLAGLSAVPRRAALVASSAPAVGFDRTAAAVRAFASNPQAASQALSRPVERVAPEHPELAAQMQQTIAGDYQYLATKLPQSLGRAGSSLTPQLEKSRVPKAEQARFMDIVHAIENPAGVIEKVAAGELPRDQIEALKARRPEIYNQMRTEAIKAFSIAKAPRGILERTRVSLAFDFNGDASLDPQTLAAIQAGNRTAAPPEDQPQLSTGQQPRQQQGAKMNPKSAETLATPSQKAIGS